jgi:hypothetical protein
MTQPEHPDRTWADPAAPAYTPAPDPATPYDPAAAYAQPASYVQPGAYDPAAGYAQPAPYGQPAAYGQPTPYAQPMAYPYGYPPYAYPPSEPTNGLAVASMVVSIVGALGLCFYGLGGYLGILGAILGHVATRQIRQQGGQGGSMAKAGIIIGWITTGIAVLATIAIVAFVIWAAHQPSTSYDSY